jgi:hypothetical protein
MLAVLLTVAAALVAQPGGRPQNERLQPLTAAVEEAHRQAITLAERASDTPLPLLKMDDELPHSIYAALVDADLALRSVAHEWPPVLDARAVDAIALQLALARDALADFTAARTDGRRLEMREAAQGLRSALGRAGAVLADAAEKHRDHEQGDQEPGS